LTVAAFVDVGQAERATLVYQPRSECGMNYANRPPDAAKMPGTLCE